MARPLFPGVEVPRSVRLGPFELAVLVVEDVEIDFQAVTESTDTLAGLFGDDWPRGLTLRQNLVDLGWHEGEFQRGTSFAWAIRTGEGFYAGCCYLRADDDGVILAPYWFRSSFDDPAAVDAFDAQWRLFVERLAGGTVTIARRTRFHPTG